MASSIFQSVFGEFFVPTRVEVDTDVPHGLSKKLVGKWIYAPWVTSCEESIALLQWTITECDTVVEGLVAQHSVEERDLARQDKMASIARGIPSDYFVYVVTQVIVWAGLEILKHSNSGSPHHNDEMVVFQNILPQLQELEWAGDRVKIAYANATDALLHLYVEHITEGGKDHFDPTNLEAEFERDIASGLARLTLPTPAVIDPGIYGVEDHIDWTGYPVEKSGIKELGTEKMAQLMAKRLYHFITHGRVESDAKLCADYKAIIASHSTRTLMSRQLHYDLAGRLLQPEVSTVEIVDVYVQMITALKLIDPNSVLLDGVTTQIREFLRGRDDAVRVVVSSLLEPGFGEHEHPLPSREDYSGQVAKLMQKYVEEETTTDTEYWPGKDLNDITWTPAPVGAGPNYYKTKYADAMGHMVTLKEKEAFAEELKTIMQERLLRTDALNFDQEERLVAMFLLRFSDLNIAQCEIMLKDMQESRMIHNRPSQARQLQAKVLSRAYWPEPDSATFRLPPVMDALTEEFKEEYGRLKYARTLVWHPAWGKTNIELELSDRVFREEVTAAQAAVIHEFAESDDPDAMQDSEAPTRTLAQLATNLAMDDDLLRSSLAFWLSKLILQEYPPASSTYRVLESLSLLTSSTSSSDPTTSTAAAVSAAVTAAAAAAIAVAPAPEPQLKTALDEMNENKEFLFGFVRNMLTNHGEMPASKMYMFATAFLQESFAYEEEDFVEFLKGLEREGLVASAGGMWMIVAGT